MVYGRCCPYWASMVDRCYRFGFPTVAAVSSDVEKGNAWRCGHREARQHRRRMVRSSDGKGKGNGLGLGLIDGGGVV